VIWQNNYNGECKINLGHSVVDWDFMNPHAITFTYKNELILLFEFTEACGHVCIIFQMRASTYSNTCLHVRKHLSLYYTIPLSCLLLLFFSFSTTKLYVRWLFTGYQNLTKAIWALILILKGVVHVFMFKYG
jgi:hypothetical protein